MGQYQKCANFARFCPNANMHEASRQFNADPMGPQAVICLKTLSVRKDVYIHECTLTALNNDNFHDLGGTLRKQFLSTSRLRCGSVK